MTLPVKPSDLDGLPGIVTPTGYALHPDLPITEWARALRLLGQIGQSVSFWIGDALLFGETTYGESAAQYVAESGLASQTLLNLAYVSRAIPDSRRRERLTWSHHAEVASLEADDQSYWLDKAEAGEQLPNGERKRWSVGRLRSEIRLQKPRNGSRIDAEADGKGEMPSLPSCLAGSAPVLEVGGLLRTHESGPIWRITTVTVSPGQVVIRASE